MSRYAPSMIKYCWIIIACLLIGVGTGLAVVKAQPPAYIATTSLLVSYVPSFSNGIQGRGQGTPTSSSPPLLSVSLNHLDPISESVSDAAQIPTRSVMDYVYRMNPQLKAHKITEEELILDVLPTIPSTNAPVVLLTVTATSPANAVLIARTVANSFIAYKDQQSQRQLVLERNYLQDRLNQYQAQNTQEEQEILRYANPSDPHIALLTVDRAFLSKSINTTQAQLAQLRTTITGGVVVLVPVSPTNVVASTRSITYFSLIAAAGLVVGLLLWLLLIFLDYRLQSSDHVSEKLGLTYLGTLAKNKDIQFGSIVTAGPVAQQLADIGVNLRLAGVLPDQRVTSQGSILLITSTQTKQGTTTVATGLAAAMARSGRSVLVIDGNLRNPSTHAAFGLEANGSGLSAVLQAGVSEQLDAAVQRTSIPAVWFLAAGTAVEDSAPLIEQRMPALLAQARKKADVIIIDGPPLLSGADAGLLTTMVDGVAVVIGHEKFKLLLRAKAILKTFTQRPVGVIMNRVRSRKNNPYYAVVYSDEPIAEEKLVSV